MNAAANTKFWALQKEPPPFSQSSITRDRVFFFVFFRQNTIRPGGSYMSRLKIDVLLGTYKKGPLRSFNRHKTTFASFVPESKQKNIDNNGLKNCPNHASQSSTVIEKLSDLDVMRIEPQKKDFRMVIHFWQTGIFFYFFCSQLNTTPALLLDSINSQS